MRIYRDDDRATIEFGVYFNNFEFYDNFDSVIHARETYMHLLYVRTNDYYNFGKYVFHNDLKLNERFIIFVLGENVESLWS